jgi:hypothetical protein
MSINDRDYMVPDGDIQNPNWVFQHRGTYSQFLKLHCNQITEQWPTAAHRQDIANTLLRRVADPRALRDNWRYLERNCSHAPGPDGLRYGDYSNSEIFDQCRDMEKTILSGKYLPDDEVVKEIPKGGNRGTRHLVMQCIFDRVVHRTVMSVIQPILELSFQSFSFAYRRHRGPLNAVSAAQRFCLNDERYIWVSVDLRDAFSRVPIPRLVQIIRHYLLADDLVDFIERVLSGAPVPGLRQGSPLSPLLMNLYLHHLLDRPWPTNSKVPLLRYADDILFLCETQGQAVETYGHLKKILRPTGMILKGTREDSIQDLRTEKAQWLGFEFGMVDDGLEIGLGPSAWDSLEDRLAVAQTKPWAPVRAYKAIEGWIKAKAPAFRGINLESAYEQIVSIAEDQGFYEIPSRDQIKMLWRQHYEQWAEGLCDDSTAVLEMV